MDVAFVLGSIALAIVGVVQGRYAAAVFFAVLPAYVPLIRRRRARSSPDNATAGTAVQRVWKALPNWGFFAVCATYVAWRGIEQAHNSNVPGAVLVLLACVGAIAFAISSSCWQSRASCHCPSGIGAARVTRYLWTTVDG